MKKLTTVIDLAIKQPEFVSFEEFEACVLSSIKSDSLLSALEIALRVTSISQAFSVGYRCALQCVLPELNQDSWAAFCVSEAGGSSPKQLQVSVTSDGIVAGEKSFVSMAEKAKQLIVIAVAEKSDTRPKLKAVLVSAESQGVEILTMPNMGMMPEVSHGRLILKDVKGSVLSGDGYADFNKPFRGIEDTHLLMSFTGLVLSKVIRNNLNNELIDQCLLIASALLAVEFDDNPWSTLQINGAYQLFESLLVTFEKQLNEVSAEFKEQWEKDKKVFSLAKKIRDMKRVSAMKKIHEDLMV